MHTKLKGRLMGAKFKTFSGAAKRAESEQFYDKHLNGGVQRHRFTVELESDPFYIERGVCFRIRKTKRVPA